MPEHGEKNRPPESCGGLLRCAPSELDEAGGRAHRVAERPLLFSAVGTDLAAGLELVDEVFNGERNAVANDIEDVLSKNTGGQLMQSKATVIGDDRVAGVAAALETNNDIGIFRQNIGDFAFSFVAPAGADNCFYPKSSSLSNIYLFTTKDV